MTKIAAKQGEKEEFLVYVKSTLAEAHAIAVKAASAFVASAKRDKDGLVVDTHGSASVCVYKPSYRLREALKQLKEVRRWPGGRWRVSRFEKDVTADAQHSINAHECACKAAGEILQARFLGDGEFYALGHVD